MKTMKKLFVLLLALALMLTLAIPAFAEGSGSITINNPKVGETYDLYKVFDLSYSEDTSAYKYTITVNDPWYAFFAKAATSTTDTVETDGAGSAYITMKASDTITDTYVVTWTDADMSAAALAVLMEDYASKNKIAPTASNTFEDGDSVVFSNLDLGYYMCATSVGALVALNTTDPHVKINDKNPTPTVDKDVKEDSANEWRDDNSADFGQEIEFRVTLTHIDDLKQLEFHDEMTGLDLIQNSVTATLYVDSSAPDGVSTASRALTDTEFDVYTGEQTDGCAFHVRFREDFLSTLSSYHYIVINYKAVSNGDAVIGTEPANPNDAWLTYGNNQKTEKSRTNTRFFAVDIWKFWSQKNVSTGLEGAKFILQKRVSADATTTYYAVLNKVKPAEGTETADAADLYDFVEWTTDKAEATVFSSPASGRIRIEGLDADTGYSLVETEAPAGYNNIAPIPFTINASGQTTLSGTVVEEIQVENKTGAELPSTGGMGTTLFYILGATLTLGAAVILITKRRMRS